MTKRSSLNKSRGGLIYGMNYAPEIGGVGRYTGEIGAYLSELGVDIHVVTTPPHYPGWSVAPGYSALRWMREILADATVYRCPLYLHRDMGGLRRLLAPLSFALSSAPVAFWQIIRRKPAVIIVVEPTLFIAPVALLGARLVGARTILHVQDLEVDAAFAVGHLTSGGAIARIGSWFDCRMVRSFDHVITIADRMRERLLAKGAAVERTTVIRNWVDLDRIRPLPGPSPYRVEMGIAEDSFVVLYAGNLGAKQGIRLVLEAAERLRGHPAITFVVAGEGPMSGAVDTAARVLPNLLRLPFQPEERFGDFLGLADLHVLPQERTAADLLLPSKLGGMLASGRRIVVTAEPGTELRDFLGESCAFVEPGNAAALAEEIERQSQTRSDPQKMKLRLQLAQSLGRIEGLKKFAQISFGGGVGTRQADLGNEPELHLRRSATHAVSAEE